MSAALPSWEALAGLGLTLHEAAEARGASYHAAYMAGRRLGLTFRRREDADGARLAFKTPERLIEAVAKAQPGTVIVYATESRRQLFEVARDLATAGFVTTHLRRPPASGARAPELEYVVMRTLRPWDAARMPKAGRRAGR